MATKYFIFKDGAQTGPIDAAEIQRQIASGECQPSSLVWHEGMDDWKPVSSLPELAEPAPSSAAAPSAPSAVAGAATPAAPAAPGAPPVLPAGVGGPARHTSGLAIASLILGCSSLPMLMMWCLGLVIAIPAVITGHMALSQIRQNPEVYEGRGLALGGLWTGYICIGISILGVVGIGIAFTLS